MTDVGALSERQLWVDMHPHFFNAADVPVRGFIEKAYFKDVPFAGTIARAAEQAASVAPSAQEDIDRLAPAAEWRQLAAAGNVEKVAGLIQMVAATLGSRIALVHQLDWMCRNVRGGPDTDLHPIDVYVPLGVDFEHAVGDPKSRRVSGQFDVVEHLAAAALRGELDHGFDAVILPIVGFDPRRGLDDGINGLAQVKTRICAGKAVGVKLYPPMGFFPIGGKNKREWDETLHALYEFCCTESVPIVAHCSPANSVDDDEPFAHPSGWAVVLDQYPALRVCLAHSGGIDLGKKNHGWFNEATDLVLEQPDQVWVDVGNHDFKQANLVDRLIERCADPGIGKRVMFATDFWFSLMHEGADEFISDYATRFRNALPAHDRDFTGLSARRFLGFDDPANPNRRRVEDWADRALDGRIRPPAFERLIDPPIVGTT